MGHDSVSIYLGAPFVIVPSNPLFLLRPSVRAILEKSPRARKNPLSVFFLFPLRRLWSLCSRRLLQALKSSLVSTVASTTLFLLIEVVYSGWGTVDVSTTSGELATLGVVVGNGKAVGDWH